MEKRYIAVNLFVRDIKEKVEAEEILAEFKIPYKKFEVPSFKNRGKNFYMTIGNPSGDSLGPVEKRENIKKLAKTLSRAGELKDFRDSSKL